MFHRRWLERAGEDGKANVSPKQFAVYYGENDYFKQNGIDFGEQEELDDEGRYRVEVSDFQGFCFPCPVSFAKARFCGEAYFNKTDFEGRTNFRGAVFYGWAVFDCAAFRDESTFESVRFHKLSSFGNARFLQIAQFAAARFRSEALFGGAWFNDELRLFEAKFHGPTRFNGAGFRNAVGLDNTIFEGQLDLQRAVFFSQVRWDSCQFKRYVDFSESQFLSGANFSGAEFKAHVNFDHVWFGKTDRTPQSERYSAWPDDVRVLYDKALVTSDSQTAPNFVGAHFKLPPNLGYTKVPMPIWLKWYERFFADDGLSAEDRQIKDRNAATKLRRLQELAADGHHHLAEKRFFRAELLCRREHEAKTWREKLMINLFEAISMCGLSFWRPVAWLGLFWYPLFLLVYACAADFSLLDLINGHLAGRDYGELLSFTAANSVPFIGLFKGSDTGAITHLFVSADYIPYWASVGHNLIATIHIFFALLAIRNYFKLG